MRKELHFFFFFIKNFQNAAVFVGRFEDKFVFIEMLKLRELCRRAFESLSFECTRPVIIFCFIMHRDLRIMCSGITTVPFLSLAHCGLACS